MPRMLGAPLTMHVFLGRYTRSATGVDGQCRLETESIHPVPRPCPMGYWIYR